MYQTKMKVVCMHPPGMHADLAMLSGWQSNVICKYTVYIILL